MLHRLPHALMRFIPLSLTLLVICLLMLHVSAAQDASADSAASGTSDIPLFTASIAPDSDPRAGVPCRTTLPLTGDDGSASTLSRFTHLTLSSAQIAGQERLTLNLLDGITYTAVRTRTAPRPSGQPGMVWHGTLDGIEMGSVLLVMDDQSGRLYGRVSIPGEGFTMTYAGDGEEEIYEIRRFALNDASGIQLIAPQTGTAVSPAAPLALPGAGRAGRAGRADTRDDGSQIDLMVIYTPAAKSILERVVGDVTLAVDGAVAHTNQILADSAATPQLNLVHVAPIFYLEQPNVDFSADLNNLMGKTDGYMDEVHTLRDQYKADLVAMISGVWFASYTGISPAPAPLDQAKGFSITEACNITDTTFAQQIGFNLGVTLDLANATAANLPPVQADGYAYQDSKQGAGDYGDFVTVMAKRTGGECPPILTANVCPIVERFSNRYLTYNGKPLGNEIANAAFAINAVAQTVANYRVSEDTPTPTSTPTAAAVNLVLNGGFEIDADGDGLPDFWSGGGLGAGDQIVCEAATSRTNKRAPYAGMCAYQFSGKPGENSRLTQTLDSAGVAYDDALALRGYASGKRLTQGAGLRLIVKYADGTNEKLTLDIPPGSYDYTPIMGELTLDAGKVIQKLKVQARYRNPNATGKLLLDEVGVEVVQGGSVPTSPPAVLPLSEATAAPLQAPIQLPSGRTLFQPVDAAFARELSARLPARPEQLGTIRSEYVLLNTEALALANASRGIGRVLDDPGIVLNLFDDALYTAVNVRIEPRPLNRPGYLWYGNIPGVAFSSVVMLISDDGAADIRVLIPGWNYYISYMGDVNGQAVYRMSQINTYEQRGFDDGLPIVTDAQAAQPAFANLNARAEDGCLNPPETSCTVDVLVAYTSKAAAMLGGAANAQIAIENTIALTNLTYMNSNVQFRLRLVHTVEVTFNEDPGINLDVLAIDGDGIIDQVHTLRDQYQADLVALIPGTSAAERLYCGIAYLPTTLPAPAEAFSVTEALCISDITFAHEVGHNMGKAHDPANAFSAVSPYAYGYQDVASPEGADWGDFVTVMAYSTSGECPPVYQPGVCPAVAWWSNPNLTYDGKPLGVVNQQDNARSLNETALIIANYRVSDDGGVSTPTSTPAVTATPSPTATATFTPMPTLTISPTFDANLTPTPRPTPTGQDLVINGGFEIDADGDKLPDGWSSNVPNVIRCNKPDKPNYAIEGNCALRLKGVAGGTSPKVVQKLIGLETLPPLTGITLDFAVTNANEADPYPVTLILTYADSGLGVNGKLKLKPNAVAGGAYTYISDFGLLEGAVTKGKLVIRSRLPEGTRRVDAVRVLIGTSGK